MKKFIIFATEYSENLGGPIALHKLCDLLNRAGYEAYLYPYYKSYDLHTYNLDEVPGYLKELNSIFSLTKTVPIGTPVSLDQFESVFWVNGNFNTPVYLPERNITFNDDWIVVYPEITFGNPLRAKNVVRWLLHNPGFHNGKIFYGQNELYFRYSKAVKEFQFPGSKTSSIMLEILHAPFEHYSEPIHAVERIGRAYSIRKGANRVQEFDLEDAISIDGKSHLEIANIFRSVKTFISFDNLSLYSSLAVLCGCESIVIPEKGISEEKWQPDERRRYGIAYGFENIMKARSTAHLALQGLLSIQDDSKKIVNEFIKEVQDFFK